MEYRDYMAYCRNLAAPPGSDLHYAGLFVPPEFRDRVFALHAFAAEIQRSLTASDDPGVVRLRLNWWYEELQRVSAAEARHPVGRALQALMPAQCLQSADLLEYLQARESVLRLPPGNATFEEMLDTYIQGSGRLWRLSSSLCGLDEAGAAVVAMRLGGLHHVFLALQTLPDDLRRGYCHAIPHTEIVAAGLELDAMAAAEHWAPLLQRQFQRLHDHMQSALDNMPAGLAASAPHIPILIELNVTLCREILGDGCGVLDKRYDLTPIRKLWAAWRLARKLKLKG